tara:strand:+ start:708 stop:818 length:111 start_codon:yes stop_codon:yes gene_type:complete
MAYLHRVWVRVAWVFHQLRGPFFVAIRVNVSYNDIK